MDLDLGESLEELTDNQCMKNGTFSHFWMLGTLRDALPDKYCSFLHCSKSRWPAPLQFERHHLLICRLDRSKYESIPLEGNNLVRKKLDVKKVTKIVMMVMMAMMVMMVMRVMMDSQWSRKLQKRRRRMNSSRQWRKPENQWTTDTIPSLTSSGFANSQSSCWWVVFSSYDTVSQVVDIKVHFEN